MFHFFSSILLFLKQVEMKMTEQHYYIKQKNDAILHEGTLLDIRDQQSFRARFFSRL